MKPHVVQVLWTLGRAGAERMVFDLARSLPDQGFSVSVIAAAGGGEMESDFREAGFSVAIGPVVRYPWQRLQTVKFLRGQIRKLHPDIWHTHLGSDVWGGWAALRERTHPWIITAHTDESVLSPRQMLMRRCAFRRANHIVCVSERVKQSVRDCYRVPEKRLSVIRIGVDIKAFTPRPYKPLPALPQLVSVGRLVPEKNHATLLKALARVDRPWQLDLIGDGPEETALRALAKSLGIASRVHFLGVISDVRSHLAHADLFCFPSRHEGQGIALLEAVASGVPVVASSLSVFRETFDDQSLLYAFSHSPKAWANVLRRALDDYPASLDHANRARRIVEQRFSLERMVEEYAKLYRQLL